MFLQKVKKEKQFTRALSEVHCSGGIAI